MTVTMTKRKEIGKLNLNNFHKLAKCLFKLAVCLFSIKNKLVAYEEDLRVIPFVFLIWR